MRGARGAVVYILFGTRSGHPWSLVHPFPTGDGPEEDIHHTTLNLCAKILHWRRHPGEGRDLREVSAQQKRAPNRTLRMHDEVPAYAGMTVLTIGF